MPWPLSGEEGAGNLVCPTRAGSALHGQVLAASHARYPTGAGVLDLGGGAVEGTRPGAALSRDSWRALGDRRTPAGAVAPRNGPPLPTAGGEGATNLRVAGRDHHFERDSGLFLAPASPDFLALPQVIWFPQTAVWIWDHGGA